MSKKALIFNDKVVDVTDTEFEVHPSMTWVDCPDECFIGGWEVADGVLQLIPKTYAQKRKAKYDVLNQFELISDDAINGTTTHKDAIVAIKSEFPKP